MRALLFRPGQPNSGSLLEMPEPSPGNMHVLLEPDINVIIDFDAGA